MNQTPNIDVEKILQSLWTECFNGTPAYGSTVYGKRKERAMDDAKQAIQALLTTAYKEGFEKGRAYELKKHITGIYPIVARTTLTEREGKIDE